MNSFLSLSFGPSQGLEAAAIGPRGSSKIHRFSFFIWAQKPRILCMHLWEIPFEDSYPCTKFETREHFFWDIRYIHIIIQIESPKLCQHLANPAPAVTEDWTFWDPLEKNCKNVTTGLVLWNVDTFANRHTSISLQPSDVKWRDLNFSSRYLTLASMLSWATEEIRWPSSFSANFLGFILHNSVTPYDKMKHFL